MATTKPGHRFCRGFVVVLWPGRRGNFASVNGGTEDGEMRSVNPCRSK